MPESYPQSVRRQVCVRLRAGAHVTPDVLIGARTAEADDRVIPGHWEGDLVRHEVLHYRAEVRDLRRCAVAAA
ncbi:hypothetical protein ACFZC5_08910 [Nocardia gamkensis]|uniref:hypothetical protein n=1 Tax=Nocardia gamkensis TaxID=352869 RepID=UPI0036E62537